MSPQDIPSIQAIRSSQHALSAADSSTRVVKIGRSLAVKFGGTVSLTEAANLEYLSNHTDIPVPKFYSSFSDPETGENFIVMEYIEGVTLEEILPMLNSEEKQEIMAQIRSIVKDLQELEQPGYLGSLNHQPYEDGVFYDPEILPPISGPFASEDELYAAIVRRFEKSESASFVRMLQNLSDNMPRHKAVFTHGDLQPKNIMLQKTSDKSGTGKYRVLLIDWEISGWYPAYWEFCNATIAGRFKTEWLDMVQGIFPSSTFGYEFLYMEYIRHIIFY